MYHQRKRIPVGWYGKKTQGRKARTLTSSFSASDWNTAALALDGNGTPPHEETVNDSFLRPEPVKPTFPVSTTTPHAATALPTTAHDAVDSNFDEVAANVSDPAYIDDEDQKKIISDIFKARQAALTKHFSLQTGYSAARKTKQEPPKIEAKKRKMNFLLPGSSNIEGEMSE
jgi:hypothetical protein